MRQGNPVGPVHNYDAIIFYNFRPDRVLFNCRRHLPNEDFDDFILGENRLKQIHFVQMTHYSEEVERGYSV